VKVNFDVPTVDVFPRDGFVIMIMIVGLAIHRTKVPIVVSVSSSNSVISSSLIVASRPCPEGMFKCASGHCVRNSSRCDGVPQCADVSDEANCPPRFPNGRYCPADRFTCNNTLCISQNWVCDGGNSDESFISSIFLLIFFRVR